MVREFSIIQSTVVDRARPKPCKKKFGVVAEIFLLKALECVLHQ